MSNSILLILTCGHANNNSLNKITSRYHCPLSYQDPDFNLHSTWYCDFDHDMTVEKKGILGDTKTTPRKDHQTQTRRREENSLRDHYLIQNGTRVSHSKYALKASPPSRITEWRHLFSLTDHSLQGITLLNRPWCNTNTNSHLAFAIDQTPFTRSSLLLSRPPLLLLGSHAYSNVRLGLRTSPFLSELLRASATRSGELWCLRRRVMFSSCLYDRDKWRRPGRIVRNPILLRGIRDGLGGGTKGIRRYHKESGIISSRDGYDEIQYPFASYLYSGLLCIFHKTEIDGDDLRLWAMRWLVFLSSPSARPSCEPADAREMRRWLSGKRI